MQLLYIYIYIYIYICVCIFRNIWMWCGVWIVCVCVCIYIYIYIHLHIFYTMFTVYNTLVRKKLFKMAVKINQSKKIYHKWKQNLRISSLLWTWFLSEFSFYCSHWGMSSWSLFLFYGQLGMSNLLFIIGRLLNKSVFEVCINHFVISKLTTWSIYNQCCNENILFLKQ